MEPSQETQLALLTQWKAQMEAHITNTDKVIQKMQDERSNALLWGIISLGTAVVGMGTWIFNIFVVHAK